MQDNIVRVTLPYSEVCMSMRVAGLERNVQITETGHAQILDENGAPFSFPITLGEAGLAQFTRQETFKRALTDDELAGILDSITAADSDSDRLVAAVFGIFRALDPDFDIRYVVAPSIAPSCYRIPKSQWIKVADKLQKSGGATKDVNIALSFMNRGPSAYEEWEESDERI
jgi:hypothetical protein